jgi:hypothetical protein
MAARGNVFPTEYMSRSACGARNDETHPAGTGRSDIRTGGRDIYRGSTVVRRSCVHSVAASRAGASRASAVLLSRIKSRRRGCTTTDPTRAHLLLGHDARTSHQSREVATHCRNDQLVALTRAPALPAPSGQSWDKSLSVTVIQQSFNLAQVERQAAADTHGGLSQETITCCAQHVDMYLEERR